MLFEKDIFTSQSLGDKRTEQVLLAAIDHASTKVRPSDLLFAAIESRDAKVLATLTRVLAPDSSPRDVLDTIEVYNPVSSASVATRFDGRKEWFSPEALEALEKFDAELTDWSTSAEGVQYVVLEAPACSPPRSPGRRRPRISVDTRCQRGLG